MDLGGKDHTAAPVGLLVEAILQEAISPEETAESNSSYVVPDNLKQFFAGKHKQNRPDTADKTAAPCCSPAESSKCC